MPTKKPKNVKAEPREMEACEELLTAIPSVKSPSEIASIFMKSPQGIRNLWIISNQKNLKPNQRFQPR